MAVATPAPLPELQAWDLGAGETAVLAHALPAPGWTAVLDDAAARKCAQGFSVPLLSTLAIIVRAKRQGLIHSAAEAVRALLMAGCRIDHHLVRTVLRETFQEDWPASEG
jgi:predicted nucleic acid-binding protein